MTEMKQLILGEFSRRLDDRFRLSIPSELGDLLTKESNDCVLAKERPGCISLWDQKTWQQKMDARVGMIQHKMQLGDLDKQVSQLQMFGRLLSTRHRPVQLAGRGRLVIPEGFREFLGVDAGKEVMVVGAAICLEVWNPEKWIDYIEGRMPKFRKLVDHLSR
jgi:MraZ protein